MNFPIAFWNPSVYFDCQEAMTMNARVAAIQAKTFLEADEQKRNIEMVSPIRLDNFFGQTIPPIFFNQED